MSRAHTYDLSRLIKIALVGVVDPSAETALKSDLVADVADLTACCALPPVATPNTEPARRLSAAKTEDKCTQAGIARHQR